MTLFQVSITALIGMVSRVWSLTLIKGHNSHCHCKRARKWSARTQLLSLLKLKALVSTITLLSSSDSMHRSFFNLCNSPMVWGKKRAINEISAKWSSFHLLRAWSDHGSSGMMKKRGQTWLRLIICWRYICSRTRENWYNWEKEREREKSWSWEQEGYISLLQVNHRFTELASETIWVIACKSWITRR